MERENKMLYVKDRAFLFKRQKKKQKHAISTCE